MPLCLSFRQMDGWMVCRYPVIFFSASHVYGLIFSLYPLSLALSLSLSCPFHTFSLIYLGAKSALGTFPSSSLAYSMPSAALSFLPIRKSVLLPGIFLLAFGTLHFPPWDSSYSLPFGPLPLPTLSSTRTLPHFFSSAFTNGVVSNLFVGKKIVKFEWCW